jgi:hypothetical protein
VIALILFCLDGLIMHVLSYQALLPAQWMSWYAPNGVVDTRGAYLHAIQWPRYLFIMSLSVPAVGLFLLAYAEYFKQRADRELAYREFVYQLGLRLAMRGYQISLVLLLVWQFVHPTETHLTSHPVGWLLVLLLIGLMLWLKKFHSQVHGYMPLLTGLSFLGGLAWWREVIRITYLKPFNYAIVDYPVHPDWPSTILFFATLLGVGGLVGGFYLTLLYRAGRVQGEYTADRFVARLGNGAVWILALWIAVFFIYGISIWLRNTMFSN